MTTTITRDQGGWTATCDRCPWLTGAQADAAIRERRGLSGACDRLMCGFAEGDR